MSCWESGRGSARMLRYACIPPRRPHKPACCATPHHVAHCATPARTTPARTTSAPTTPRVRSHCLVLPSSRLPACTPPTRPRPAPRTQRAPVGHLRPPMPREWVRLAAGRSQRAGARATGLHGRRLVGGSGSHRCTRTHTPQCTVACLLAVWRCCLCQVRTWATTMATTVLAACCAPHLPAPSTVSCGSWTGALAGARCTQSCAWLR